MNPREFAVWATNQLYAVDAIKGVSTRVMKQYNPFEFDNAGPDAVRVQVYLDDDRSVGKIIPGGMIARIVDPKFLLDDIIQRVNERVRENL